MDGQPLGCGRGLPVLVNWKLDAIALPQKTSTGGTDEAETSQKKFQHIGTEGTENLMPLSVLRVSVSEFSFFQ